MDPAVLIPDSETLGGWRPAVMADRERLVTSWVHVPTSGVDVERDRGAHVAVEVVQAVEAWTRVDPKTDEVIGRASVRFDAP